jgi:putative FmdB family regulatory protein
MPLYEYECRACGRFDDLQPVSAASRPATCPRCGEESPRVISLPRLLEMDGALRRAHEVNERNAHEPTVSTQEERHHRHAHGPNCACCSSDKPVGSSALYGADGSKMFPTKRPWMISH